MIAASAGAVHPNDLIMLGSVFKICEMEAIVLGGHLNHATVNSEVVGGSILCNIEANFSFRGRFALPKEWCAIGCLHQTQKASACHGTPVTSGTAFTVLAHGVSEFIFGAGSNATIALIPVRRMQQKFAQLVHPDVEIPARLLGLFSIDGTPMGITLGESFDKARYYLNRDKRLANPNTLMTNELDMLLENHMLAGLGAPANDRPQPSRGRRAHHQIVQRAEHYMRENLRRVIYLDELCAAAGVSERALRYAFDDIFDLSPNRYLSMLRLCTAFRVLSASDASRRSVKSVALSCGLWDLSRFANHYRHAFGELPHDTLMRTPPVEFSSSLDVRELCWR
jgi:AraC family ethanolamine operon transcriptional activator